jgi:hypothetical protein
MQEPVETELPDPLLRALAPPVDETPAQRTVREAEEEKARLVSERIDDEIRRGHMSERGKTPVKVVLLGPERSGASVFVASTRLCVVFLSRLLPPLILAIVRWRCIGKAAFLIGLFPPGCFYLAFGRVFRSWFFLLSDFWKSYAPHAWREELLVWSTVIRLYLVRSVTKILDVLDHPPETPHLVGLLRVRLSTLRRAQRDLEEVLGLAKDEVMSATAVSKLAKQGRHDLEPHLEEVEALIIASRDDMVVLWEDEDVRAKLETHERALNEQSRL